MSLQQAVTACMARKPFVWGESDCCLAACDVLVAIGLPDPAQRFRGTYDDAAGAADVLARHGGLVATVTPAFASLGWPEIRPDAAMAGDIGIVMVPTPALAVFDGDRWCVKAQRGMLRARKAAVAWATGYRA